MAEHGLGRRRAGDRGRLRRHRLRRRRRGLGRRGPARRLRRRSARVGAPRATSPLPGGDAGVRSPCRMALAHLRAAGVAVGRRPARACAPARADERGVLAAPARAPGWAACRRPAWAGCSTPSSSLAGVRHRVDYEAQAAIELEALARARPSDATGATRSRLDADEPAPVVADPAPVVARGRRRRARRRRRRRSSPRGSTGRRRPGRRRWPRVLASATGLDTVALSGGVFLNALLTAACARRPARARLHGAAAPLRAAERRRHRPRPGRWSARRGPHAPTGAPTARKGDSHVPSSTRRGARRSTSRTAP